VSRAAPLYPAKSTLFGLVVELHGSANAGDRSRNVTVAVHAAAARAPGPAATGPAAAAQSARASCEPAIQPAQRTLGQQGLGQQGLCQQGLGQQTRDEDTTSPAPGATDPRWGGQAAAPVA